MIYFAGHFFTYSLEKRIKMMENQKITFLEFLSSIIHLFIKQRMVILLSVVVAILLAVLVYFNTQKSYEASFTFQSNIVSTMSIENRMEGFITLTKNASEQHLAEALNLPVETAKALQAIEYAMQTEESKSLIDEGLRNSTIVQVTIKSASSDYFEDYQNSVLHFLENSPFIQEQINETQQSMASLEKQYSAFLADSSSQKNLNISVDGVPSEKVFIAQQLERIKSELNQFNAFRIISEAIAPQRATNKNLVRAAGVFVFINLIGVFIAILKQAWPSSK